MPVHVSMSLDLNAKIATEVWNFEAGQSILCPSAQASMRMRRTTISLITQSLMLDGPVFPCSLNS